MELRFLLIALWVLNYSFTISGNAEGDALVRLKNALTDPTGVLSNWNGSAVNPCKWFHITCNNDNSVTRIDLGNAILSGELVPELGLLPNLQYIELYGNDISGTIPLELGNLTNLVSLDLYQNMLSGPIPDTPKMRFLRLNNNTLSGVIPYSLTNVNSLQVLDLSNNNLSGVIPSNGSFSLFTINSFLNNPNLMVQPPPSPSPNQPVKPSYPERGGLGPFGVAAGVGAAFFFFFVIVWSFGAPALTRWRRLSSLQDPFIDVPAEEEYKIFYLGQIKRFSLREMLVSTDNFDRKNVLGRGGFGKVYKGRLADGSLVAVKRLKEERTHGGELQFQTELEMISLAVHCNLLRLKGFCMTPTERLLVYPYMANGSVASRLRDMSLDWPKRKRIALGSARGLTYLHEQCNPKIIHPDIKAANILLDEEFEAVVGDFGLAKLMDYQDTHIITAVCGTFGHIAPEYLSMGESSEKSDIFAYGVMLLELVTGQQAFDLARLANNDEFMWLNRVKGFLEDKKFELLVDRDLQENCTHEAVEELTKIALLCTQSSPMERPKMSDVVRMLEGEGLAERWQVLQKDTNVFRLEFDNAHLPNAHYIVDYNFKPAPDELSGPR